MEIKGPQIRKSLIFHLKFIAFQVHIRFDVYGYEALYGGQMASNSRIIAFSMEIHSFFKFTNDLTYTARRPRMEAKGRQMQASLGKSLLF